MAACQLSPKTKLTIGCAYKCGLPYKLRLNLSAYALGYKLDIVNLRDFATLEEGLAKVDAVLIPGGADINPDYYSDKVTPEMRSYIEANRGLADISAESNYRDPFEYALVRKYLSEDSHATLPMLGICRGMQMMSVAQGIPLYLDIKTELGIKNRRYLFDRVHVEKGTKLDEIYLNDSFKGFEMHHQGLRVPYFLQEAASYPDVKVTAYSNNNMIAEGIEYQSRPAIGVQYHPEKSLTGTAAPIFRWFLTESCEYQNAKVSE